MKAVRSLLCLFGYISISSAVSSAIGGVETESFLPVVGRSVEQAVVTADQEVKKDWKRPIVIAVGGIGAVGTIGWNYIAAQSFFHNRQTYNDAKKALEAQKAQPKPQPGDTYCTVMTYLTDTQVSTRTPSTVTLPCWRLTDFAAKNAETGSDPHNGAGGQHAAESYSRLNRRGLDETWQVIRPFAVLDEQKGVAARIEKVSSVNAKEVYTTLSKESAENPTRPQYHGPHDDAASKGISAVAAVKRPLTRLQALAPPALQRMERIKVHKDMFSPGHVKLTTSKWDETDANEFVTAPTSLDAMHHEAKSAKEVAKEAKKVKTEDITFALTVLNAVGTLPSLILTSLNAYLYRGNPKVD